MALRPRPRLPEPDGAARPPGGLRAGGARLREAEPRHRGRVPAQGTHAAVVVAPTVRGAQSARRAAALSRRAALAPRAALRQRLSAPGAARQDRKSTRLNSSHVRISYAVFCLKKKKNN